MKIRRENLFPKLINELHIKTGVEVGVAAGIHSANILTKSNIEKLYCIDPYFDDLYWAKEKDGNKRYDEALLTLDKWIKNGRAELIRKTSLDVVGGFDDNSLGFVYLDGDRSKNVFPKDVDSWLKKIKIGGILAGHDYKNKRTFMVKFMIDKFCKDNDFVLKNTTETCKSWWFVKNHSY